MKKWIEKIKKALGMDKKSESSDSSQGFTLIELLVVIAVIGILAAALLLAIDPIDKIRAGNDTKVLNDARAIYDGSLRSYTSANTFPTNLDAVVTAGELKSKPTAPTSYRAYDWFANNSDVTLATDVCIQGQVMSKSQLKKADAQTSPDFTPVANSTYIIVNNSKTCYRGAAISAADCQAGIICN
jgi:prepilin-type N-terminal cleavage/methylation domain-containing protein